MVARPNKKQAVQEYVRACGWARVGADEWGVLRAEFAGTAESTVRGALSEMGIAVDQPFAGVSVKTLEELEVSLLAMAEVYPLAKRECRIAVIAAKDRARFAAANEGAAADKRAVKSEMVEWMLVWLGDPAMFKAWVGLRKRQQATQAPALLQVE